DCMKVYNDFIPGRAPKLLFDDEQNYIIIMEAAHEEAVTWKDELLRGNMSVVVAEKIAAALATVHNKAATCENVRTRFHDKTFFAQLRTDPYLETLKARHPDIEADIEKRMATLLSSQITL